MANPSTLRQGRYSPGHGSRWGTMLYDENCSNCDEYLIADKFGQSSHTREPIEQPAPWWSLSHFTKWIRARCSDPEHDSCGSQLLTCLEYLLPIPHLTTTADGLFPLFHADVFGIDGVSGLHQWIFDSGASSSCCNDLSQFSAISKDVPFKRIRVANNQFAEVEGIGTVSLNVVDSSSNTVITVQLKDVLYIPKVPINLISTRQLWEHSKIRSEFTDSCTLHFPNGTTAEFKSCGTQHYYCVTKDLPSSGKVTKSHVTFVDDLNVPMSSLVADGPSLYGVSADTVHARLGHCGPDRAVAAIKHSLGLPDIPRYKKQLSEHCEWCRLGGARTHPFHERPHHVKPQRFGDRIQSDICGEFPLSVTGNFKYILSFVDAATGYSEIYFLESKHASEVKSCFERFIAKWKHRLPDGRVGEWFTDNGGEFVSNDLHEFCDEFATKRGFTVPYCSPQNGQAERLWGILQRCIRILLVHSNLPINFWHFAARQANNLHNLLPRHSNDGHKSPFEAVEGKQPDFSKIRVWGCVCYCTLRNDDDKPTRVSPTGAKAVHLGCDPKRNGWICYIPSLNRITTCRDITFDEKHFLRFDKTGRVVDDTERFVEDDTSTNFPVRFYNDTTREAQWRQRVPPTPTTAAPSPATVVPPTNRQELVHDSHSDATPTHWSSRQCSNKNCNIPSVNGRHSGPCSDQQFGDVNGLPSSRTRSHFAPPQLPFVDPGAVYFNVPCAVCSVHETDGRDFVCSVNVEQFGKVPIPNTYDEAMASKFAHRWKEAMEREIRELLGRRTWEAVDLPKGRKATRSRWVFAIKYNSDGTIERFKARFVVCGYSQIQGLDYEQSFSSTMRATTFRTLLALAAQRGLRAEHLDISNAFCQADIDGVDIWVQPPRGFESLCASGQGLKLLKALYGTKQASYLWQQTLSKWLVANGFTRLKTDPCVFIKSWNGRSLIVGCYVDDLVVLHDPRSSMFSDFLHSFLRAHGGKFDGKHIGRLEWFLGVKVESVDSTDGGYSINQSKYIGDLLDRFIPNSDAIAYARRVPYPPSKFKELGPAKDDEEIERVKQLPYLQLIGALLYLSTMSRPDISYHMSVLCSHMQNPSLQCYEAAQSLLLYVGKTRHLSIRYSRNYTVPEALSIRAPHIRAQGGVCSFSDSTWTAPRSTCGYVVFMSGGPVAYSSRKLNVIADSSALAEYSAASACCKELTFVRHLLSELHFALPGPVTLAVDNSAALTISQQSGVTKLTKHFDFSVHRLRDEVERSRVSGLFVPTYDQIADVFTKPLDEKAFLRHRDAFFR